MSRHRRRPREFNQEAFDEQVKAIEGHSKLVKTIFKPVFIGFGSLIFLIGIVIALVNLFGLGSNPDTTNGLMIGGGMMAVSSLVIVVTNFIFKTLGQSIKELKGLNQEPSAAAEMDELREESIPDGSDRASILRLANRTPRRIPLSVTCRVFVAGFWNQFSLLFMAISTGLVAFWIMMLGNLPPIMKFMVAGMAVLPAVGCALCGKSLWQALRCMYLLKDGSIVYAKFKNSRPMQASINGRQVKKLTFEFDSPDGSPLTCEVNTATPEQFSETAKELAIYNSQQPQDNQMLKGIPGMPIIGHNGELQTSTSTRPLIVYFIAPLFSVVTMGLLVVALMTLVD